MKTDTYTKVVLTVIAVCLLAQVLERISPFPVAYAGQVEVSRNVSYGLIPLNEDGSINVTVTDMPSDEIDVNIDEIAGHTLTSRYLPVELND